MKYRIWFEQINQTMFDVKARTPEAALKKAKKEWKAEYNYCPSWYMEDENGEEVK